MCGIFGSSKLTQYKKLFNENKKRGTFSYGQLTLNNKSYDIHKQEGVEYKQFPKEVKFYVGHTQAPTSADRTPNPYNIHPFEFGNWIVAHNGVLSNYEGLKEDWLFENTTNVDTEVIPYILHYIEMNNPQLTVSEIICYTLEELEGTFGLVIYYKKFNELFLARQGSTLYGNIITSDFSSVPVGRTSTELEEYTLYQITHEGLTKIGKFNGHSPFFIL